MIFAAIIFFASLIGIVSLFYVKYLELRQERVLTPALKEQADGYARDLKELLARSRFEIAKTVPIAAFLMRLAVREFALQSAALLRFGEKKAHELADMVGHKHRFERRETRSEFLRQVGEHPFRSQVGLHGMHTSHNTSQPADLSMTSGPPVSIAPSTPSIPQKRKRAKRTIATFGTGADAKQ